MKNFFMHILIFLLGHMLSSATFASDKTNNWYQIDLIVFRQPIPNTPAKEPWLKHVERRLLNQAIELMPIVDSQENEGPIQNWAFQLLPSKESKLKKELLALKRNHYDILCAYTWHQTIPSKRHSKPIHIVGGQTYETSDWSWDASVAWELNGTITLSKNRFLNVNTDLILTNLVDKTFQQLQQSRNIRSKEVNYFDHPMLGAVILITPIEIEPLMTPNNT